MQIILPRQLRDDSVFKSKAAATELKRGMASDGKKIDVEQVLDEVKHFGVYHAVQYALVLLPVMFTAMSNANFIFAAENMKYRCLVPNCENGSAGVGTPPWWPLNVTDAACSRPVAKIVSDAECSVTDFGGEVQPCDRWVYESDNSIVAEFDLACDEWRRTLVGTVHNIGVLVSMPLFGYVSDRWGRSVASICSAVGLAFGALKTITRGGSEGGYTSYLILELVEATLGAAIYTSAFVLVMELGGKERRVLSTAAVGFSISIGELLLGVLVYFIPHWKHMLLIIYCPTLLFLSYIFFLKESVRWLLINGKNKRAKRTLQSIERVNKITISENVMRAVEEGNVVCDKETTTAVEEFNIRLLFSSSTLMKRLVVCSWWWFSSGFIYYGLMINSVTLPGNKYVNYCLSAAVAFPGDIIAIFTLNRFGRKKPMMAGFIFCGVCCVANGFIPSTYTGLLLTLFLMGKAAASLCYNVVYVYTSELFPTSARSSLLGICSMASRVGTILAPMNPLLVQYWSSLPTLLFGASALLAGAMMLLTPETLNSELPDTVAQAERLDKKSSQK